jgi:predicted nucleotide-binding protein (sugar kinase/HSP70/actin superfamily)
MGNDRAGNGGSRKSIKGRTLYVPQMSHGGSMAFAAAFRSAGINARISPDGDARTLELGRRYTSGEECLPAQVTLGNFLKVTEQPDFEASKTAFFMPTADGPCRFGQYSPYIKKVLREIDLDDVMVVSPTSRDGYDGMGENVNELMRNALRGLICADVLRKMTHRTRPYESSRGDTDKVHEESLERVEKVLEVVGTPAGERMKRLVEAMTVSREEFRKIPAKYSRRRPLIGVVGEIFCRMTPFTNDFLIRKLEEFGAECALAHIVEWVWYTNAEQQKRLRQSGQRFSVNMLGAKIKNWIQQKDEHAIYAPFHDDLKGYEEPEIHKILEYSQPYLPHQGALGEMTLSVGKAVFHYHQGCDGVVDISPFTCMNGIVTEAIYPMVSHQLDSMPIRNFFFDGTQNDLDRDVGIFMELAHSYQQRKRTERVFPDHFPAETATVV